VYIILTVTNTEQNTWEFQTVKLRLPSTYFVDVGSDGKQCILIVSFFYLSGSHFARPTFCLPPVARSLQRLCYGLDDQGFRFRFPKGIRSISKTPFSVAHRSSYTVGTESYFPGVKRPGREADHPPRPVPRLRMWRCNSSPRMFSCCGA
jgi:hypothetical protein